MEHFVIAGKVTAVLVKSNCFYIFDPPSRDQRGLHAHNGTSVLLKITKNYGTYLHFHYEK